MIYQAIFIILIVLCCFVYEHEKESNNKLSFGVVMVMLHLFLFAALRSEYVGSDAIRYYQNFRYFSEMSISEIFTNYITRDPFFRVFEKGLSLISKDPRILFAVVSAFVSVFFIRYAVKQKDSFTIVTVSFIALRLYSFTMSALRQSMAMSMCWLAAIMLHEKRYVKFCAFTIVGALFHGSALIFLLALPLSLIKKPKYLLVSAASISIIDIVTKHSILRYITSVLYSGRFTAYIDEASSTVHGASTTFIIYILMFIIISISMNRIYDRYGRENIVPIYNLAIVAVVLSFMGQSFPNLFRLSYYFIIYLFALITPLINTIFTERSRKIAKSMVIFLLVTQYIVFGSGAGTENYVFFWNRV